MSLEIDRARFVSLAFGMAGPLSVACNTGSGGVAGGIVAIPAQPPLPAEAGAPAPIARLETPLLRAHSDANVDTPDDEDSGSSPSNPAVDNDCIQVTTKCKAVSMADCRRHLARLNATQRTKVVACVTSKTGCGFGIHSCTENP